MENDTIFLRQAIEKSRESVMMGAFPVGSLVVRQSAIMGAGVSNGGFLLDPTSHAEIAAIREACQKVGSRDLTGATLYSSMEPCLMCYGASFWAAIERIVYACRREKVAAHHHYEGSHNLTDVNNLSHRPMTLFHIANLEEEALRVISEWESAHSDPTSASSDES